MSNESKALELAADVDDVAKIYPAMAEVSTELRRQHAEIERLRAQIEQKSERIAHLEVTASSNYDKGHADANTIAARVPDADEMAEQIRWVNGANKMGAGELAEHLCDWIASRFSAAPSQQAPHPGGQAEYEQWRKEGSPIPDTQQAPATGKCAQCKKEYRANTAAKGCPKCAPGLQIAEAEFKKPTTRQAPVAQGWPVAWKHDCAALLQNDIELWVARCPHCGKPKDTTPQQASEPMTDELESALETLVSRCNNDAGLANDDAVIAAESALERLYKSRTKGKQ